VLAIAWIVFYLALVTTPLFVLLVEPRPPAAGFWWDFAIALGFSGAAMMGVQFVLTARFKRATAPYGIDIIYYFHRVLAVVTLLVVLAHPLLLLRENSGLLDLMHPVAGPWYITTGVWSLVAMLLIVASSVWRKALRLPYEPWRVVHVVLAVAALVLAGVHIEGVGVYVSTPWVRLLWVLIVASCVGVVVWVRLIKPWRLTRTPYEVTAVRPERGDAWTLAVAPRGHAGFPYQAGQFAWITLRSSPFAMREHPFSFSSAPSRPGTLEFTIKELGDFTRSIHTVRPGETVYVDGPYGAFTLNHASDAGCVFVAGGIGIAPLMSLLRALADARDTRRVVLIYAYRVWERLTFREELAALSSQLDLTVVYVLLEPPDDWTGERGLVTAALIARHVPVPRARLQYYVCGPTGLIAATERALGELGVPATQVHSEIFDLV
jgi:predicted ferric reductase